MADSEDKKLVRMQQEADMDQAFKSEQTTIIPVDLDGEMRKSFIDYTMSVISDRALPDIRDGMKPVHRRIIYSMFTQGFTPDKPYRKCATTVGDVLGRFHPHGDASVYDALVRLAQDFSLRHPLVDGHGNFGSLDGDPPAAYRYTEARLDKIALEKPEPEDFDAYWAKQRAELAKVPVKADVKEVRSSAGTKVYAVAVDCAGPRPVTGYLVVPEGARAKSCVARVHFQGYGTGVQQPPGGPAQKGEIFFEVNAHGYDLGMHRGYYDDFFSKIAPKGRQYAFSKEENADPDTAYFHGMALRVLRALEFMKTRGEWNGKDLIVEGGSQGGLQTSWAAGLDKDVTLARPFITWGCNWGFVDGTRIRGPWHIPWAPGLGYYDAVSHIARAKCRVEITRAGLGDYTCPPSGLALFYNAIRSPKSITWVQGSRHGHTPVGDNQVYVEKSDPSAKRK